MWARLTYKRKLPYIIDSIIILYGLAVLPFYCLFAAVITYCLHITG